MEVIRQVSGKAAETLHIDGRSMRSAEFASAGPRFGRRQVLATPLLQPYHLLRKMHHNQSRIYYPQ
jgi:hypothetical protein